MASCHTSLPSSPACRKPCRAALSAPAASTAACECRTAGAFGQACRAASSASCAACQAAAAHSHSSDQHPQCAALPAGWRHAPRTLLPALHVQRLCWPMQSLPPLKLRLPAGVHERRPAPLLPRRDATQRGRDEGRVPAPACALPCPAALPVLPAPLAGPAPTFPTLPSLVQICCSRLHLRCLSSHSACGSSNMDLSAARFRCRCCFFPDACIPCKHLQLL